MKKVVYILATGGTISGAGANGVSSRYSDGAFSIQDLLQGLPPLPDSIEVRGEQVLNISSDDVTFKNWITLTRRIHELASSPEICGFVITHGTNTMEETAFFLDLTIETDKAVVLTGSMRPATALSADGPMNLFQAIYLAAHKEAAGRGVLVCFSDAIYCARYVQKINCCRQQAFGSRDFGCTGLMRDNQAFFFQRSERPHALHLNNRLAETDALPRVDMLYFHSEASADLVDYSAARAKGIILIGAGAGLCSKGWKERIRNCTRKGIPVIRASKTGGGIIVWDDIDDACGTIPGYSFSPEKLRILLSLCLTETNDIDKIHRIVQMY